MDNLLRQIDEYCARRLAADPELARLHACHPGLAVDDRDAVLRNVPGLMGWMDLAGDESDLDAGDARLTCERCPLGATCEAAGTPAALSCRAAGEVAPDLDDRREAYYDAGVAPPTPLC